MRAKRSNTSDQRKKPLKRGRGQPPFEPTKADRERVGVAAAFMPHEQICLLVKNPRTGKPISVETLLRAFPEELATGKVNVHHEIANSLYRRAREDGPAGVTAAIFLAKTRMGFREKQVVELEVKSGVLVAPTSLTPEQWIAAQAAANAAKKEPGADAPTTEEKAADA